ncbi:hypothetical protein H9K76_16915 [Diaphorobacter ruginosibacter]|uniref:Secreted protein n=1 Tax=Diaphorobacter ruginosibacter TaxID=1715720 RepID=A0A7G9RKV0_9BURK|nr:hypothetical protein [Diaphorobacter ruginosibacter]QNN56225.1 hypothetical protein H9K76_16915 [Diaphorobacter ruginosibacter]
MTVSHSPRQHLSTTARLAAVLLWGLASGLAAHAAPSCDAQQFSKVQEQLARVASWDRFAQLYENAGACDRAEQTRAFTQAVARLSARPGGVSQLDAAVRKRSWLKPVVLRHLRSGAVGREDSRKIVANVERACPQRKQTQLCRDVRITLRGKK